MSPVDSRPDGGDAQGRGVPNRQTYIYSYKHTQTCRRWLASEYSPGILSATSMSSSLAKDIERNDKGTETDPCSCCPYNHMTLRCQASMLS